MAERGEVTSVKRIVPNFRKHEDPGDVFAPRPVARAANPGMVLGKQASVNVPAGMAAAFRWQWRDGGSWSDWDTRPGPCVVQQPRAAMLGEVRLGPAPINALPSIVRAKRKRSAKRKGTAT